MRGTAKLHGFLHIGAHLVAKGALGHMVQIHPHFHMHTGKIGQFFEVWVFPGTQAGLGVDSPHKPAGDLQNTPGTPAMHFPLAVAGSQSALYIKPACCCSTTARVILYSGFHFFYGLCGSAPC